MQCTHNKHCISDTYNFMTFLRKLYNEVNRKYYNNAKTTQTRFLNVTKITLRLGL